MKKQASFDVLDNKTTREVYHDLRRRGLINGMRFDTYLGRLKERNVAARRDEYNNRRISTRYTKDQLYA